MSDRQRVSVTGTYSSISWGMPDIMVWRAQHIIENAKFERDFDGMFGILTTKMLAQFSDLADCLVQPTKGNENQC